MDYSPVPPEMQTPPEWWQAPSMAAVLADYRQFVRAVCEGNGWDYRTHWLFASGGDDE